MILLQIFLYMNFGTQGVHFCLGVELYMHYCILSIYYTIFSALLDTAEQFTQVPVVSHQCQQLMVSVFSALFWQAYSGISVWL